MNATYDPARWATETKLGRRLFNFNFRLTGEEMRGWELVNVTSAEPQSGAPERIYLFQRSKAARETLLRVDIVERENWRGAQERLQTTLLHCMHPELPRGKGDLSRTGDVCYVGEQTKAEPASSAFFTRGNLFVSVTSVGEAPVDVVPLAKKLDDLLSDIPKQAKGATAAKERSPHVQLKDVIAGEAVAVVESLEAVKAEGEWLKVVAPDGELRRENDKLVYVPEQGGTKSVSRYISLQATAE
jgi:hypothetical protein